MYLERTTLPLPAPSAHQIQPLSSASEEMGTLKLQEWGFVSKRLSEPEVGFWGPSGSSGGQTQTLVATSLAKDPGSGPLWSKHLTC